MESYFLLELAFCEVKSLLPAIVEPLHVKILLIPMNIPTDVIVS